MTMEFAVRTYVFDLSDRHAGHVMPGRRLDKPLTCTYPGAGAPTCSFGLTGRLSAKQNVGFHKSAWDA